MRRIGHATAVLALTLTAVLLGWWTSGLFTAPASSLSAEGFGEGATNLLSPIIPSGWSSLLPDWWKPTSMYWYEGFHYFGAGLLALVATALIACLVKPHVRSARVIWPLVVTCAALALFAASPRLTMGDRVLAQLEWFTRASMFRANGRFFWPADYLLLAAALGTVIGRTPSRVSAPVLAGVLALQLVDLRVEYAVRREIRRDPAWYTWTHPLTSPVWRVALPHYDSIVIYQPPQCGPPPTLFEDVVYLAGLHGLRINGMLAARADAVAWSVACAELDRSLLAGEIKPRTIYLGAAAYIPEFRARALLPTVCGLVDGLGVCVTADSYQPWREAANFE